MDYKDKLKLAKEALESYSYDKNTIEYIFPELVGEDERIRRYFVSFVELNKGVNLPPDDADKMLAWLKKQKDIVDRCACQYFEKSYNDTLKKKKPAEWSEEDEKIYTSIMDDTVQENQLDDKQISWLKSLKDRVLPQPKQEWSEEDKEMRSLAVECIEAMNPLPTSPYSDCIRWLKSLNPQPKQEWDKKDIDMIDYLIRCCETEHEELCNDRYGHQDIVSDLKRDCRKKWDWLESLRGKITPQKRWKPSDEQIEIIRYIIDTVYIGSHTDREVLVKLYNDLKKL